ncbi:MAG: ATP-binding protein [Flavobacteriales bacterium]|nr:ATP-binding protein [Flavobacteriales bacterium]
MYRNLIKDLIFWKEKPNRKPLIIQGARQVGKTWLMKSFGETHFKEVVYINFESSVRLQNIFKDDFSIERIISIFEIESGKKIISESTLIILDEIQEAYKGLTALKYFQENAPKYFVIAAGSLIGVSIQKDKSFPVGKVDFLTLYPMSFEEFLINHQEEGLVNAIKKNEWSIIEPFHEKLTNYLRLFYFVGGMPEAQKSYLDNKSLTEVRNIQQKILLGYENDFAKYAPITILQKIRMVWQTILGQLAKENKKFIYGQIKQGARAKDFEEAINWLVNAGLILKSYLVTKPTIPLKAYVNFDIFKLYLIDIGLLNAMANISEKILLNKSQILTEFKGALTEQFVAQEFNQNFELHYWSSEKATAELDFIIQKNADIIPIEVKAEENLKAKSLKVFEDRYQTNQALRLSMSFYRKETWLTNFPLYTIFSI